MFSGKVIFVTGGASGLGRTLVESFLKENAKVFFTYHSSKEAAVKIIEEYGEQAGMCRADASDFNEAKEAVRLCTEMFGKIDVLVNNSASVKDAPLIRSNETDFKYTIDHVLFPVFAYTKAVSEGMIENKSGTIISIGSINGLRGREGSLAYSTAKAGIIGFSKTVAKELGEYNITCNVIAPGYIATESQTSTSELIKGLVLDECAIRRLTKPQDVADLVLFLASGKAKNITGQVYKIDCGQYI